MARVGLEDLLRMLNARGAMTASYFSELDPALAEAVQRTVGDIWRALARLSLITGYPVTSGASYAEERSF
eukprot:1221707-Lingulodinium_polyedra.AAC.1